MRLRRDSPIRYETCIFRVADFCGVDTGQIQFSGLNNTLGVLSLMHDARRVYSPREHVVIYKTSLLACVS